MMTYLFYDVETSGLNPAFDQILTFAAIRTDARLKEIERTSITIRLRDDIVPSPGAFLTHGLTSDDLDAGVSEYEAALEIHELFNTPGTISVGYNSLGFDDEFIRFMFYRNLLDPYLHQYNQGCSRADILPVVTIYRVFHPQVLSWPENNGKSSLKLDLIAEENGFVVSGRAHEAMSDVEALVQLSKRLMQVKEIWEYCLSFFNKTRDEVRISQFENKIEVSGQSYSLGILVAAAFGPEENYLAPALLIGRSHVYKNQSLWLRLDQPDNLGIEQEIDIEDTWVVRKRFGDGMIILPMIDRFVKKLTGPTRGRMDDAIDQILTNQDRFQEYARFHRHYQYPFIPEMDIDASLYQDGFFSGDEKRQAREMHAAISAHRFDIPDTVQSERIRKLCQRILVRSFQEKLSHDTARTFDDVSSVIRGDHVVGYKNDKKLTITDAAAEFETFLGKIEQPDEHQQKVISWLKAYFLRSGVSPA